MLHGVAIIHKGVSLRFVCFCQVDTPFNYITLVIQSCTRLHNGCAMVDIPRGLRHGCKKVAQCFAKVAHVLH